MAEDENMEQQNLETPPSVEDALPDYLKADKITLQDLTNHMMGPGVSLVLHIVLLAVLGTAVLFETQLDKPEMTIEATEVEIKEAPKPPEPPEPPEETFSEVSDVEIDRPTVSTDIAAVEVDNVSVNTNAVEDIKISTDLSVTMNNSALKLPGVYASRSASGRKTSLKQYGGNARTEASVNKALDWLAKVQNEDGSWGESGPKSALTAIATLAFLARGETPQSAEYGDTVLRALKRLVAYADALGPNSESYSYAMLAYAISEGYSLTKIPMLERAMNKTITNIVNGQNDLGGYDYGYKKTGAVVDPKTGKPPAGFKIGEPRCDLSVAGWNYQAMKAAYAGGCKVEGLEAALDKAVKCIKSVNQGVNGTFTYTNSHGKGGGGFAMTSVGTLCLQLLGDGRSKEAKAGMKYLENLMVGNDEGTKLKMDWKKYVGSNMPLYTWYYMTQAIFQGTNGSGRTWDKWNKSFRTTLTKEQSREGYWDAPTVKYPAKGAKEPVNPASEGHGNFGTELGQRVWSTSMCTLMLEVYYRFLPTFKVSDHGGGDSGSGTSSSSEESFDSLEI